MSKAKIFIKNNKFLVIVLLAYLGVFVFKAPMGVQAIQNSGYYFKEMVIIMPAILLLTALLDAWIPKQAIEKHLGKNSGIKGAVFSFLLGSVSAGPVYAAFPVCVTLLKKGASIMNIVILLSTWAVLKIPMLANEAKFLSPKFMFIRWILTTAAIFLIGFITSKFVKQEEIPSLKESDDTGKGLFVKTEYCVGCGLCAKISPDFFEMIEGKAIVLKQNTQDGTIFQAAERCPAKAIQIRED